MGQGAGAERPRLASDRSSGIRPGTPISYTPAVADGPDCPWVRGRRTRWWLVAPADLVTVACVAFLAAGAQHDLSLAPELVVHGAAAVLIAWLTGWLATRPGDHLECLGLAGEDGRVGRGGSLVVGVTWLAWVIAHTLASAAGAKQIGSFALMLGCFLLIGQGGWRWLYGFAKAQESVTPRAIRRRQEQPGARRDQR